MEDQRKLKGSVIQDMVKVVRAVKDAPWDQYLRPEDWDIVNSMVMPSAWYPIASYMRIGAAVYKLAAKENEEAVRSFGRAAMKELFESPYRPFLEKNDPFEAIRKFLDLRKTLFNFSRMEAVKTGDRSLRVVLSEFGAIETGLDVFMILSDEHFRELAALNGGKKIKSEVFVEGPKEDCRLRYELAWE